MPPPIDPSDVDGLKKANITVGLILAMVVVSLGLVALLGDIEWSPPPIPDASCGLALDSAFVRGRNERGYYHDRGAAGPFALSLHLVPYAPRDCVLLGAEPGCRLGDVAPPFVVVNASGSDTLTVVKGGRSVPFRVSKRFCEEMGLVP
jgi:hypothetical protein